MTLEQKEIILEILWCLANPKSHVWPPVQENTDLPRLLARFNDTLIAERAELERSKIPIY